VPLPVVQTLCCALVKISELDLESCVALVKQLAPWLLREDGTNGGADVLKLLSSTRRSPHALRLALNRIILEHSTAQP
jgi:hypothetical protein